MIVNNDALSCYMLWFSEFWLVHIGATPYWWDGINATLPSLAPCLDHITGCFRSDRLSRCLSYFTFHSFTQDGHLPCCFFHFFVFHHGLVCWMAFGLTLKSSGLYNFKRKHLFVSNYNNLWKKYEQTKFCINR